MLDKSWTQFAELLSVAGGQVPFAVIPMHLPTLGGVWEPVVILTFRPRPKLSFTSYNLSLTRGRAQRLLEDLKQVLVSDPLVTGSFAAG